MATDFGTDIACVYDADAFFSTTSGIDLVRQDAIHRLLTDDILGDDGTGSLVIAGWGYDVRRLLGMPASRLASMQPVLSEVLTRDERVDSADVTLTSRTVRGLTDVLVEVVGRTADGAFSFVLSSLDRVTL